jgi:hypothetical protein
MAKNFNRAGSVKTFEKVSQLSSEKAVVTVVKMIHNDDLTDCPMNHEDVSDTLDLEKSIGELGFIDPLEVTAFNQPQGKYMIVSGQRRRAAGVKCGIEVFPCFVKEFQDTASVNNYVLLANSQRDSAKDPLLYCKRYKWHEAYLNEIGFPENVREEIARRMGISVQQADRYKQLNKVIPQALELIRQESIGMSSLLPLATFDEAEQLEILKMLKNYMGSGQTLTRENVKEIVEAYRNGAQADRDNPPERTGQTAVKPAGKILKAADKLAIAVNREPHFENRDEAIAVFNGIAGSFLSALGGMYALGREYNAEGEFRAVMADIERNIRQYMTNAADV